MNPYNRNVDEPLVRKVEELILECCTVAADATTSDLQAMVDPVAVGIVRECQADLLAALRGLRKAVTALPATKQFEDAMAEAGVFSAVAAATKTIDQAEGKQ